MRAESLPSIPPKGKVLVDVGILSVDAFVRTMMNANAYHGALELGDTVPALGVGKVLAVGEGVGDLKEGMEVVGMLGCQRISCVDAEQVQATPPLPAGLSSGSHLGLLGLTTGLTAWAGVFAVARPPVEGETVVISAAAGAVGTIASQLAKSTGARVIGVAGGPDKCDFLTSTLGLDAAIDYKAEREGGKSFGAQLDELAPEGVDFFFDNVGGSILDDVLLRIRPKGRVALCGAVSQYSGNLDKGEVRGPSNYLKLAERGASMAGFNVLQHVERFPEAVQHLGKLFQEEKIVNHEQIEQGLELWPAAMEKMFHGGHMGKLLVQVRPE